MKQAICLFIWLFSMPGLHAANRIDSLKTDTDVLEFLKSIEENFRSGKYKPIEIRSSETLRKDVNCNGKADEWEVSNWQKADFNGDGRTDLLVMLYWYNYGVHVVLDQGNGTYKLETLSHNVNKKCELANVLEMGNRHLLLIYQEKYEGGRGGKGLRMYYETDTLIYKYGGFIEYKNHSPEVVIDSILFRAGHCQGSCPVFSIRLDKNGKGYLDAGPYNPKQGNFTATIKKEDVDNLTGLVRYLSLKDLKDHYNVHWANDQTVWLQVWYSDGTMKEIEDYGMHGTYGLRRLYNMLFDLRRTQNWQ